MFSGERAKGRRARHIQFVHPVHRRILVRRGDAACAWAIESIMACPEVTDDDLFLSIKRVLFVCGRRLFFSNGFNSSHFLKICHLHSLSSVTII